MKLTRTELGTANLGCQLECLWSKLKPKLLGTFREILSLFSPSFLLDLGFHCVVLVVLKLSRLGLLGLKLTDI